MPGPCQTAIEDIFWHPINECYRRSGVADNGYFSSILGFDSRVLKCSPKATVLARLQTLPDRRRTKEHLNLTGPGDILVLLEEFVLTLGQARCLRRAIFLGVPHSLGGFLNHHHPAVIATSANKNATNRRIAAQRGTSQDYHAPSLRNL